MRDVEALGGRCVGVACDHRDDAQVAALFERVAAESGRLDVLVNNAFLIPPELTSGLPFWETPLSNWDDMIDVGTRSAYAATWHAARPMTAAGRGLIVNISSSGASGFAWHVAYGVGKCALDRVTADTAHQLRDHGVTVVSLWPGLVLTERLQQVPNVEQVFDVSGGGDAAVLRAGGGRAGRRRGRAAVHGPGRHGPQPRRRVRLHRRGRPPAEGSAVPRRPDGPHLDGAAPQAPGVRLRGPLRPAPLPPRRAVRALRPLRRRLSHEAGAAPRTSCGRLGTFAARRSRRGALCAPLGGICAGQCRLACRCSRRMSRPKSPSKSRHTEWTWLPSFWMLSYSIRNVGPCTR